METMNLFGDDFLDEITKDMKTKQAEEKALKEKQSKEKTK